MSRPPRAKGARVPPGAASGGTGQDRLFAAGEGDAWFLRNKAALDAFEPRRDPVLRVIDLYGLRPRRVLEVGCSNGVRLEHLRRRYGCRADGVEPSARAVKDGRTRFPRLGLARGTAADLKPRGTYDLVVAHFVFHWIDRASLLRSAAAVDATVADGGFLLIGDFLPYNRLRVPYHHLPGADAGTYKQDYGALFAATGLYQPVAQLATAHGAGRWRPEAAEDGRVAVQLLRKDLRGHYQPRALPGR